MFTSAQTAALAEQKEKEKFITQVKHSINSQQQPWYRLLVIRKGQIVQDFVLDKKSILIGKHKDAQVQLAGFSVSKKHARLSCSDNRWSIEDLSSMTGTYVNNERILDYDNLQETDSVQISDYQLKILAPSKHTSNTKKSNHQLPMEMSIPKVAPLNIPTLTNTTAPKQMYQQTNTSLVTGSLVLSAEFNEWRQKLHHEVVSTFDLRRHNIKSFSDQQLRDMTREVALEILKNWQPKIPASLKKPDLVQAVLDDIVGLGPLEALLKDSSISEIMVNSPSEIFVEMNGRIQRSPLSFPSDDAVLAVIDRIITPLGRRIDQSSPMVDARLKDGSRVNAIIPPLAIKGPCITIRKFPSQRLTIEDLIGYGSMDNAMAQFFKIAVAEGKNILVSGGTGTGKTTLLNVLSNQIPLHERVITIEDAAELQLNQPDLVSLESKPANLEGTGAIHIRDLVKNALRMRPNRIVVGECRGAEALDMLQAMNTGHDGSLTTLHANTPRDALSRLEVMVMMAGMDIPVQAIREQIASAIHVIVQQTRFPCGSRKVTYVTEVVGMEAGIIQLQDIFLYKRQGVDLQHKVLGQFQPTGYIPTFYEELATYGKQLDTSIYTKQHLQKNQLK